MRAPRNYSRDTPGITRKGSEYSQDPIVACSRGIRYYPQDALITYQESPEGATKQEESLSELLMRRSCN
jgi:hypothetical protein